MNYLKQFEISFKGLKIGSHQFEFFIDEKFFDNFEFSEVKEGKVSVNLLFQKNEKMLILEFIIKGHVKLVCDRCLENFDYPVKSKERLIVKFGKEYHEESEDVLIIPDTDHQINVSHLIYEYITLSLPIKRVHSAIKDCDPKAIDKLKKANKIEETMDPRWEALKKLKTKNK